MTAVSIVTITSEVTNKSNLTWVSGLTRGSRFGVTTKTDPPMDSEAAKPGRTRLKRRSVATRDKLLKAARAVFAEKGLDLARVDEITNRADVGKGTFYYHFGDKDGLIRELILQVMGELEAVIEEKCKNASDIRDLLDKLIEAHIAFFCNRWEDFVLYFQGRSDLTLEVGYQGIETPFLDYLTRVERLIESVLKTRVPKLVLRRIACAVVGFVSGYYSFAVIASEEENVDQTFSSLRGAIVASLARFIQEAAPPPKEAGEAGKST